MYIAPIKKSHVDQQRSGREILSHTGKLRYDWVDFARGLCIILVVFVHAAKAHYGDITLAPSLVLWIYDSTLPIRMPLFFLLSGLFIWPAIAKGRGRFIRLRWWGLVYPYFLWSIITILLETIFANRVNSPLTMSDIVRTPIVPVEQFWFLYALFVLQMVAFVSYQSLSRLWLTVMAGLVALSVFGGAWMGLLAFQFAPFLAAGVTFSKGLSHLATSKPGTKVAVGFAGGIVYTLLLTAKSDIEPQLYAIGIGLAGSFLTAAFAMSVAHTRIAFPIILCGRASLIIFAMHTIVSAGTRIGFRIIGFNDSMALSFVAGIGLPVIIWYWADRNRVTPWLGLGTGSSAGKEGQGLLARVRLLARHDPEYNITQTPALR